MPKRILAIDDEIGTLAVIQRRLEAAGYEVITATDGREGLNKARSEQPDLILLDLILPNLSGFQICAMLKGDRTLKSTPILMLTARAEKRDIEEGVKVGADAYMTKPYDPELLVEQIETLLRRAEEERAARAAAAEKARPKPAAEPSPPVTPIDPE